MMGKLVLRHRDIADTAGLENLDDLRIEIDKYDTEMLEIINKRMAVAEKIGRYKKENNLTVLQPDRWQAILDASAKKAENLDLSDDFVKALFKAIHQESINKQTIILNE
jgi:chorismate mutase